MFDGRLLAGGLLIVLVQAGSARAQAPDVRLADRATEAVRSYAHFSIFDDVTVAVDAAVVRLEGCVTEPFKRAELATRVGALDGVREVRNDIRVLPDLDSDADLRRQIANAIYGHPTFWRHAAMERPPIHIVVERGHVRLTGIVSSRVERQLAQALAQVSGAGNLTNQIRTGGGGASAGGGGSGSEVRGPTVRGAGSVRGCA